MIIKITMGIIMIEIIIDKNDRCQYINHSVGKLITLKDFQRNEQ